MSYTTYYVYWVRAGRSGWKPALKVLFGLALFCHLQPVVSFTRAQKVKYTHMHRATESWCLRLCLTSKGTYVYRQCRHTIVCATTLYIMVVAAFYHLMCVLHYLLCILGAGREEWLEARTKGTVWPCLVLSSTTCCLIY